MIIDEALFMGIRELNNYNIEDSNLKAKLLISNVLNVKKEYILIHGNEKIPLDKLNEYFKKIERLAKGEPIQYILQSQEFFGINFYVDENVLIPQPDTETLVIEAIKTIRRENRELKVLDLCTGSGAIGICLARENNVEVTASDISSKALEVAKKNCTMNNVDVKLIESDLFENIKEKYDIIVSNPPYIESSVIDTLSSEVRNEPRIALDGGEDGLDYYRRIAEDSKDHLFTNGYLIVEIGYNQKDSVEKIFKESGYKNICTVKDLGKNYRVIIANKGM